MSEGPPVNHDEEHWKNLAEGETPIKNSDLFNFFEYIIHTHEPGNDNTDISGILEVNTPNVDVYMYFKPKEEDKPYDEIGLEVGWAKSSEYIELRKSPQGEVTTWWNTQDVQSRLLDAIVIEGAPTRVNLSGEHKKALFKSIHSLHTQTLQSQPQIST